MSFIFLKEIRSPYLFRVYSYIEEGRCLLSDLYQITMAYAYWKSGKMNDHAVFDLFFRKNPFQGEFTIFAGLEECIKFLNKFHYSSSGTYLPKLFTMAYVYIYIYIFVYSLMNYITQYLFVNTTDIKYLKSTMPTVDQRFFDYLQSLTAKEVTMYAIDEGSVVFPR